jgi:mannose-6-phosphate isomerase-like protein (cupin superfamily)
MLNWIDLTVAFIAFNIFWSPKRTMAEYTPENLVVDIRNTLLNSDAFRQVITTTDLSQLVIMTLQPNQDIGMETHTGDQIIHIQEGYGQSILDNATYDIYPGVMITIPAGVKHNIINNDEGKMRLFTVYTPPEHDYDEYQLKK